MTLSETAINETPTNVQFNLGDAKLPNLEGEILNDLFSGSTIIEARHDGKDWHILVERPVKLKDCRGREDETWKYATYKQLDSGKLYHASSYNYTPREMRKKFNAEFWEDRCDNRRIAEVQNA